MSIGDNGRLSSDQSWTKRARSRAFTTDLGLNLAHLVLNQESEVQIIQVDLNQIIHADQKPTAGLDTKLQLRAYCKCTALDYYQIGNI